MCLTPNVTFPAFTYKAIHWARIDSYWTRLITYAPSFILEKLFLEQTPLNLGSFQNIFVFQS